MDITDTLELPGIVVDEPEEQFLPSLSAPQNYPVGPAIAQHRAEKYAFAMSDDKENPGVDSLRGSIMNGQEGIERQRAATRKAIQNQTVRQQMIRDVIAKNPKLSKEDFDLIQGLSDSAIENPDTVFEKEYAEKMAQRIAVDSTSYSGSEPDQQIMDQFTNIVARKEGHQKILEDLEAEWQKTGIGSSILTYAEQIVPFKSWYNIQNAIKQAPTQSFLPGNNLQEQISYLLALPPDESIAQAKQAIDQIKSSNMLDAISFARALISYSTTDQFLNNSLGIADLSIFAPGIGLIPYRSSARFATTMTEVIKASGNRTTTVPEVLEAAGRTTEAAHELAWKKVQERASLTHNPNSMEALKGEILSLSNPGKIFTGASNSLSREESQYLQNFLENQAGKLVQETVVDPVEITRIKPGTAAWDVMIEEADKLRRTQYFTLNEAVLDVVPINGGLGNVNHLGIRFGTHPLDAAVAEGKSLKGTEDLFSSIPPVKDGYVRFYHGADAGGSPSGRKAWITSDPEYARNFRTTGAESKEVWYVDLARGSKEEVAARAWDDQLDAGTNIVGTYRHIELPAKFGAQFSKLSVNASGQDTLAIRLGEPGKPQLFGSEDAADLVAKELYGFSNYTVGKQGDGYYIQVTKALDELSPSVGEQLQLEYKNATPKGLANTMFGWWRSPQDTLPKDMLVEMVPSVYGGSKMTELFKQITSTSFEELPKFRSDSRKNMQDFLSHQRSIIQKGEDTPGKFSKTQGEFEQEWLEKFKKTPTLQESKAYWTYVQVNDIDWILNNLSIYRDKAKSGHEMWSLPIKGVQAKPGTDVHTLEGVLRSKIPWESKERFKIVVWDENPDQIRRGYSSYTPAGKVDPSTNRAIPDPQGRITKTEIEDLIKGNYKIIQLSRYGKQAIKELPLMNEQVLGKGAIDFVIVKQSSSKPLDFMQLPYKPGGHIEYKQGFFVRQPHIVQAGTKTQPEYQYYGDKTVWHFETEGQAQKFSSRLEQARQMLLANDAGLELFANKQLGMSLKSVQEIFAKHLDTSIPIGYTPSNRTMKDQYALQQKYVNFRDINDTTIDTYRGEVGLKYAADRGATLNTIRELGTSADPILKFEAAKLLDPMAAMSRAANNMMKGRYLEDLKAKSAQRFIAEFGDLIGVDRNAINQDTFRHLMDPKWVPNITDRERLATAQNFRRATIEFLGLKNETQKDWSYFKQKLADSVYKKYGDKGYTLVEPYLMHRTTDPVQFMRSAAFHTKLGLFSPVQMFLQAQTMTHIIALAGPVQATKAMFSAMAGSWSRFTDKPGVMNGLAKLAGMDPHHFKESVEAYRRTGMNTVGGEVAVLDDFLEPNTVRGGVGKFFDWGRKPFDKGERLVRDVAWHASYNIWRAANPTAKLTDDVIKGLVTQADTYTVNMTRASNAMWQKGVLSIPTQFFAYQVRLMEQMLGKRLTPIEKARAFLTYSTVYGVPVSTGMVTALYPWHEEVRQSLLERGIDTDSNMITKVLNDGMVSPILELITNEKWNFGERYGPGGVSFIKDLINTKDKSGLEVFSGVAGKTMWDILKITEPFGTAIANTMRDDDTYYPLSLRDFYNPAIDAVSSASGAKKLWNAVAVGRYVSKNGTFISEADTPKGLFMFLTGMNPQSVSDAYRMIESAGDLKKHQAVEKKEVLKNYRAGFQESDPEKQIDYFRKAKVHLVRGMFQPDEVSNIISESFRGYESLVDSVSSKFAKESPERLKAWADAQTRRNR